MLAGGTAAALLLVALGHVDAGPLRYGPHVRHGQAKKEPPKPLQDPLIVVSIGDQRLTLYDRGEAIAHAPVSTGMPGHATPTGVFSVLEKEVYHRSNIYSGAPMPYMQRITWSGVALHAGVLPGYAASHGCIRMPPDFAIRLFRLTRRGARVIVTPKEVAPVPFENAHLFTLSRPADTTTGELATPAVRTADSQTPAVMSDATDTAARPIDGPAGTQTNAPVVAPSPAAAAPDEAKAETKPETKPQTNHEAIDEAAPAAAKHAAGDANGPAEQGAADAPDATKDVPKAASKNAPKSGDAATGAVLVKPVPVVPARPIEVKKTFEPSGVAAAPAVEPAPAATPAPAPATQAVLEPYGPERPLRPGPITVFVSKKEGKVFVRKGFQQILAAPVTIAHPERTLGTHMFTAIDAKPDGVSFDWLEVSMPAAASRKAEVKYVRDRRTGRIVKITAPAIVPGPVATAAEALARIEIPPAALARISSLMSPGATLIVSDQGLGPETGLETDFIVLTR